MVLTGLSSDCFRRVVDGIRGFLEMVALLHAPVGEDGGAVCFHSRNVAQNHGSHAECANAVRGGAGRFFFGILLPVDIAADIHGSGGQQRGCRGNDAAQHGEQGNECYEGDYVEPEPEHVGIVGNSRPVCQARPLTEEIWCVEEGGAVASC